MHELIVPLRTLTTDINFVITMKDFKQEKEFLSNPGHDVTFPLN